MESILLTGILVERNGDAVCIVQSLVQLFACFPQSYVILGKYLGSLPQKLIGFLVFQVLLIGMVNCDSNGLDKAYHSE